MSLGRTVFVHPNDEVVVREPLTHAERGRLGGRAKWKDHAPTSVRLNDLTPDQRRLVLAMVEAARNELAAAEISTPATAEPEVQGDARPAT